MSKLLKQLKEKKVTLIVELPENDLALAQAAIEAGADALIIKDREKANEILQGVKVPVGVDLSKNTKLTEKELKSYDKFDFISFHFEVLPTVAKGIKNGKILALNEEYTLDKLIGVEDTGAQAIDAAIVPLSQKNRELMVGDLQNYIAIAISSNLPVIVPTQRHIKPSEVAIIADTGAKGIILTAATLGESSKSLAEAVREFRTAADDLGE